MRGYELPRSELRLAEFIASLSLATDLGIGVPLETSLRICVVAVGLGELAGLSGQELSDVYYASLLQSLGCTSTAHEEAVQFGDELGFRATLAGTDVASPPALMARVIGHVGEGTRAVARARAVFGALTAGTGFLARLVATHCEASTRLAQRLGLGAGVVEGIVNFYEFWNGKGAPQGLAGERIPLTTRLTHVGYNVAHCLRLGVEEPRQMLRRRAGGLLDPTLVDLFVSHADDMLDRAALESVWDLVLESEPEPRPWIPQSRVDDVALAFADFTDLKSVYTLRHSTDVAELAAAAGRLIGLDAAEVARTRHAGLLHSIGRISVPNSIWEKSGRLTAAEWERVRLYPHFTQRVLEHASVLKPLATLAGATQERLDGSGYHRGLPASVLTGGMRVLAAADMYTAMGEEKPQRPSLSPNTAVSDLRAEVKAARIDGEAAEAVLEAAGGRRDRPRASWPAELSDREVEVLRLLARGLTNKQAARRLFLSEHTVGEHVKHIYGKAGVSTRAGAALFAMENDLLRT